MRRRRPRLLDLFCGAGGAATGYHRAGFDVIGVDVDVAQLVQYPYTCVRADVMALPFAFDSFDAIHASPPCQPRTTMSNRRRGSTPDLLDDVLAMLRTCGKPWVVENVTGARPSMPDAVLLTGGMFGLRVHRPRLFASNVMLMVPPPCAPPPDLVAVYGRAPTSGEIERGNGRVLWTRGDGSVYRAAASLDDVRDAMGMPWADWRGATEAIPPAYTEHIGAQLIANV